MEARPTAAVIIIGDEILKGQTQDTNSYFLCQELYKCGVKVARISVIPDDTHVIAEEVLSLSKQHTYVLTSGGIGPTHDDVTYAGIAKAFGEKLAVNEELSSIFKQWSEIMSLDKNTMHKMSLIPVSSVVHFSNNPNKPMFIPIVSVQNVFVFPGIPSYLRRSFTCMKHIFDSNSNFYSRYLYLNIGEFDLTEVLNRAVDMFKNVRFGSYPNVENDSFRVKLTLEADSEQMLERAEAYLRSLLPSNVIVSPFQLNSDKALKQVLEFCDDKADDMSSVVRYSKDILTDCLKQYSMENICLSFNGGKDCTVLLHLVSCIFQKKLKDKCMKLPALYICSDDPFAEIEEFVQLSVERYNLDLIVYGFPIKDALMKLQNDRPEIRAILMGTRGTDPHASNLQVFQMTDSDWPQFMRISPLLHWGYQHIWKFLRKFSIPYCSLYDRGYTSLGCRNNTLPNPKLKTTTENGEAFYLPAYFLKEPNGEREGRSLNK